MKNNNVIFGLFFWGVFCVQIASAQERLVEDQKFHYAFLTPKNWTTSATPSLEAAYRYSFISEDKSISITVLGFFSKSGIDQNKLTWVLSSSEEMKRSVGSSVSTKSAKYYDHTVTQIKYARYAISGSLFTWADHFTDGNYGIIILYQSNSDNDVWIEPMRLRFMFHFPLTPGKLFLRIILFAIAAGLLFNSISFAGQSFNIIDQFKKSILAPFLLLKTIRQLGRSRSEMNKLIDENERFTNQRESLDSQVKPLLDKYWESIRRHIQVNY